MKKNFLSKAFLLVTLPFLSWAESTPAPYTAIDVVVDFAVGKKCRELDFRIFATTDKARKNLTDRTDEFRFKNTDFDAESPNVKFYESFNQKKPGVEYAYENDDTKTYAVEIPAETRIEEGHQYGFRIGSLTARNGADLDTWGGDVIRVNGHNIESCGGAYGNTGNDLFLSAFRGARGGATDSGQTHAETATASTDATTTTAARPCRLCGLCPVQPLGLCLFVWIALSLVLVVRLSFRNRRHRPSSSQGGRASRP